MLEWTDTGKGSRHASKTKTRVRVVEDGHIRTRPDTLATEEPMEIRLLRGTEKQKVAITMRTPGSDFELAAGFLYGEGILTSREQIRKISYCTDPRMDAEQLYNIVNVRLEENHAYDPSSLERNFYTTSSCGVCGKASLEQLEIQDCPVIGDGPTLEAQTIRSLPEKLREAQGLFEDTGGLHAAALFDTGGELVALREDVGRHNAVDKLVGWALLEGRLPLADHILMVSGRTSFEILQKSLMAGTPAVCAISAPSSLAVDLARRFDITLIGFLRGPKFNVYSGFERVSV